MEGPAEICGIPLPEGMVEKLRASAKIKTVARRRRRRRSHAARPHRRCRRGYARRCCAVTGTAAWATATAATGCRSITSGQDRGAAATTSPTSVGVRRRRHRPPRRPRAPRTVAAAREPEPRSTGYGSCTADQLPALAELAGADDVLSLSRGIRSSPIVDQLDRGACDASGAGPVPLRAALTRGDRDFPTSSLKTRRAKWRSCGLRDVSGRRGSSPRCGRRGSRRCATAVGVGVAGEPERVVGEVRGTGAVRRSRGRRGRCDAERTRRAGSR